MTIKAAPCFIGRLLPLKPTALSNTSTTSDLGQRRAPVASAPGREIDDQKVAASGQRAAGLFADLDFTEAPLCGEFFTEPTLRKARELVRAGLVEGVRVNVQGRFGGVFCTVRSLSGKRATDVSVVLQQTPEGRLLMDGRSSAQPEEREKPDTAAAIMAAMIELGVVTDVSFGLDNSRLRLEVLSADVRAGIMHMDAGELRGLLSNLRLVRLSGDSDEVETRLREMGLRRLVEWFAWDEIEEPYRQCYAYHSERPSMQEIFWSDFIANRVSEVEALGAKVIVAPDVGIQIIEPIEFYGEIEEQDDSVDWFSFECGVYLNGEKVNLLPSLIRYLESKPDSFSLDEFDRLNGQKKVPLQVGDDGPFVAIPAKRMHTVLSILHELFDYEPMGEGGTVKLHRTRAAQVLRDGAEVNLVDSAPVSVEKQAAALAELKPEIPVDAPKEFQATLRFYQQDGFEWLQFLREQKLGGVLADDMGLGKTIQTLCHLHAEAANGRGDLPTLILAPKSVVPNWVKEAKKFAPSLKVLALQGAGRKKYYPILQHCDLVVTSYPVLLRDAEELLNQPFHYVVLDEAHTIKNSGSQVTKVAYQIDARHRLCLTGTPIENNLGELWSLFHFLMPGFLGSEDSFNRCFRNPIEKGRDEA